MSVDVGTEHPDRVQWGRLSQLERDAILDWLAEHHLNPKVTPIDPLIEYDPATDEWRVEQYSSRDGSLYLRGGEVATHIVRRRWHSWLPWRAET